MTGPSKKDLEDYRKKAADAADAAREAALEASVAARKAAKKAKQWAEPRVELAVDWAEPRAKHMYHEGARKASPYVKRAGTTAAGWTDAAHAAIVGAAIPAVIAAVENASREDDDKKGSVWPKVVIPMVLAAAAGAALVAWARRDPGRDAWAGEDDEWEFADESAFKDQLRDGVNRAADAAADAAKKAAAAASAAAAAASDALSEKAGPAYDKFKEQAGPAAAQVKDVAVAEAKKVAEVAGPAVVKVKDTAVAEAKKVKESVEEARQRAVDALDDAEDVWEDEGGSGEDGLTPVEHVDAAPAPKKAPAKKPPASK